MTDKYNDSHCKDMTAYEAIENVSAEEKRVAELIRVLKYIVNVSGFEVIGRIGLRNKATGRKYL
jgi:hypothetical protein